MPTVHAETLLQLAVRVLRAAGATEVEADIVGPHLVEANLVGHDSHGVMRVLQYVQAIERGAIEPGAEVSVVNDWPTGAVLDARGVFGQVACRSAMEQAIDKARPAGLAALTIRHANHTGRLGAYVAQAAAAGMIGMAMVNGGGGGQWVTPFGGRGRRLSTNPVAISAPSAGPFPIVLDISTSVAPEGKVRDCLQRNQPVPDGWLVDHEGRPTNDPRELYTTPGGALLPFGGSAGHKGFGLAFLVDVFAGALSAAGCPRAEITTQDHGSGVFLLVIDIARFSPLTDFTHCVHELAEYCKTSPPAVGCSEVLVPGEFEYRARQQRERAGIAVPDDVWRDLVALANQLGVPNEEER
ncbi:MAG: Ldh family oxidoreductase [Pirellulales bacterium]|nr:Ldh family oxidoreductase [Pirellulales bacterium]